MIAVKIYWNTYKDGTEVDFEAVDWNTIEAPVSICGPFDTISDAISFIENDYPEGDADVHDMVADDFDIPDHYTINDPVEFLKQFEEEDIRPESQEIHGS